MSQQTEFKVGDIVQLKSGGPEMTVSSVPAPGDTMFKTYTCQWFAGKKLEKGQFMPDSLKSAQKKSANDS